MKKRAVIVGVNGQDGRILYDFLLARKYSIVGVSKNGLRCSDGFSRRMVDILKYEDVARLIKTFQPHEVYHLAAFHHSSEDNPAEDLELFKRSYAVNVLSLMNFLEAIRNFFPKTKIFYAASSRIFEGARLGRQNEGTPVAPNCIYGLTKAVGLSCCRFYRNVHSLFASVGILYNHESHLRTGRFISRKIVRAAVAIKQGRQEKLILGDLSAKNDWGYAPDYVDAMHRILHLKSPDDFIIATGQAHTVKDFVKIAFDELGLDWKAQVKENRGIVKKQKLTHIGNSRKLKALTGWRPSVDFEGMVRMLLRQEEAAHVHR